MHRYVEKLNNFSVTDIICRVFCWREYHVQYTDISKSALVRTMSIEIFIVPHHLGTCHKANTSSETMEGLILESDKTNSSVDQDASNDLSLQFCTKMTGIFLVAQFAVCILEWDRYAT